MTRARPHGEEATDVSMALVMSQMPDVWRKVLAEYVPDGTQHCQECRNEGGQASWPCQTYRIAQEAKWVAEGNLPGTGPHGPGPTGSPSVSQLEPSREHPHLDGATTGGFRPLAGDPLGTPYPEPAMTGHPDGDQPYGSTFDAPYGASFGVDDRPHAARY